MQQEKLCNGKCQNKNDINKCDVKKRKMKNGLEPNKIYNQSKKGSPKIRHTM